MRGVLFLESQDRLDGPDEQQNTNDRRSFIRVQQELHNRHHDGNTENHQQRQREWRCRMAYYAKIDRNRIRETERDAFGGRKSKRGIGCLDVSGNNNQ